VRSVLEERRRPLPPNRFIAHHSVPYGRVFRQWMTNGDLVVWVNRGEVEDPVHGFSPFGPPKFRVHAHDILYFGQIENTRWAA
jgi:hypothetical protein